MNTQIEYLRERLDSVGASYDEIKKALSTLRIGIGDWCTLGAINRFRTDPQPGGARTAFERVADMALINRFCGMVGGVTINAFPVFSTATDRLDEYVQHVKESGITVASVQPNSVRDPAFGGGSISAQAESVRSRFFDHVGDSIGLAHRLDARSITLWFADGTNYPGETLFADRIALIRSQLKRIYDATPHPLEIHLEYKLFEPATYHTDIADWGSAFAMASACGPRMKVLVDVGHHAQATNVEHIVASLVHFGRLGSIHMNSRKYADDDLNVASINPYELFLVLKEIARSDDPNRYQLTLDEFHVSKLPLVGVMQSIVATATLYAKTLAVNRQMLQDVARSGRADIGDAHLQDVFQIDVRPLIGELLGDRGFDPDPVAALSRSSQFADAMKQRNVQPVRFGA